MSSTSKNLKREAQLAQTELVNQPNIDMDPVNVGNQPRAPLPTPDKMMVDEEFSNELEFGDIDDSAITDLLLNVLAPFVAASDDFTPQEAIKRLYDIFSSNSSTSNFLGKLEARVEFFKENMPKKSSEGEEIEKDITAKELEEEEPTKALASLLTVQTRTLEHARKLNKVLKVRSKHFARKFKETQGKVLEAVNLADEAIESSENAQGLIKKLLAERSQRIRHDRIVEALNNEIKLGLIEKHETKKRYGELLSLGEQEFLNVVARVKKAASHIQRTTGENPLAGKVLTMLPMDLREEGTSEDDRPKQSFWS